MTPSTGDTLISLFLAGDAWAEFTKITGQLTIMWKVERVGAIYDK